ncbi:hyalin-like isoform X2 [Strongylocentrotus purpuratus]|uniref:HYR domain-containing protein n=1 Tax=Strongylocentrotus purpuratus TaxID=7668 RepID=A0A7M7PQJ6_STRPU|nr:hyalin-like isoform X2 [Strongylocentrotus purpuratus]
MLSTDQGKSVKGICHLKRYSCFIMIHQATIYPGTDGTRPSFLNWPSNINETVPFGSSPTTLSWTEPIGVASVAASQSSGSFFVVGYTNVASTATDASSNFESCSFSVTVTATIYPGTDGTRPSFLNWPSNINETVPFGSSPTTLSWTEPIGVASVAASQSSGSFFVVGYTNVASTATDASSNFESCSLSVTVTATIYPGTDGTRPSFLNWPSNINETVPFGSSPTTLSWTEPIGVASVAASQSSGSFFVVGYTNVASTSTDASSNFESCSFSVTVTDANSIDVKFAPPTATDNSGSVTSTSNEPGDQFAIRVHTAPSPSAMLKDLQQAVASLLKSKLVPTLVPATHALPVNSASTSQPNTCVSTTAGGGEKLRCSTLATSALARMALCVS